MNEHKAWWQSWTIWSAIALELLATACDSVSLLDGVVPENAYKILAFSAPLLMIVLRRITTQPMRFLPAKADQP